MHSKVSVRWYKEDGKIIYLMIIEPEPIVIVTEQLTEVCCTYSHHITDIYVMWTTKTCKYTSLSFQHHAICLVHIMMIWKRQDRTGCFES